MVQLVGDCLIKRYVAGRRLNVTLLCIRVYVGRFDEDVSPPGAAGVSPFDSFSFDCLMVDGAERYCQLMSPGGGRRVVLDRRGSFCLSTSVRGHIIGSYFGEEGFQGADFYT